MTNPPSRQPSATSEQRVVTFLDHCRDRGYGDALVTIDGDSLRQSDLRRLLDLLIEFRKRDEVATRVIESARNTCSRAGAGCVPPQSGPSEEVRDG